MGRISNLCGGTVAQESPRSIEREMERPMLGLDEGISYREERADTRCPCSVISQKPAANRSVGGEK